MTQLGVFDRFREFPTLAKKSVRETTVLRCHFTGAFARGLSARRSRGGVISLRVCAAAVPRGARMVDGDVRAVLEATTGMYSPSSLPVPRKSANLCLLTVARDSRRLQQC